MGTVMTLWGKRNERCDLLNKKNRSVLVSQMSQDPLSNSPGYSILFASFSSTSGRELVVIASVHVIQKRKGKLSSVIDCYM